jgi:hypothetical protein
MPRVQSANGWAEKSTKPQPQLTPALTLLLQGDTSVDIIIDP